MKIAYQLRFSGVLPIYSKKLHSGDNFTKPGWIGPGGTIGGFGDGIGGIQNYYERLSAPILLN